MFAPLTVRRLKPGTYEDWRRAWEPEEWPEGSKKAYILRNTQDPNEIIAFGLFEGDPEQIRSDQRMQEMQRKRFEAMAPFVESTGADGLYEVVEVVEPASVTA